MVLCVRWHLKVRKFRNSEARLQGWGRSGGGEVKEKGPELRFQSTPLPRKILIMQSKV